MRSSSLIPDFDVAQRFLDALEPNGKFTFQTFDDDKAAGTKVWPGN